MPPFVISPLVAGANFARLYGTDFHVSERPLVVILPCEGKPLAVVPSLELSSFAAIEFEGTVFDWQDQNGYQSAFDAMLAATPIRRLGVEGQNMRVFIEQALRRAAPSLEIIDLHADISALRLHKNDAEITALRKAIAVSENALAETLEQVREGMSEKTVESILVQRLFAGGADDFAFSPIVAAGANAALPHAHASDTRFLRRGDALLFDFGARVDGLCADITRTVFVGECSERDRAVYETVLAANAAGIAAAGPGASAHAVDDAATRVLEASAFSSAIRHKTGHGLGRDVHEAPWIMRGNEARLETGMVFTVEPGLYIEGELGVRIEDDVLITDKGAESLTGFPKTLTVLPC